MLHLAQVREQEPGGKLKLVLLAQQKFEHMWTLLPDTDEISVTGSQNYNVGALVLVDLDGSREVQAFQDATAWVLTLVERYLSLGLSPEVLKEEVERAEEWRRKLTLQSQEHSRRSLEMEARRDQIQELEENLKREKKQLEAMAAEMRANGSCHCKSDRSQSDDSEPEAPSDAETPSGANSDAQADSGSNVDAATDAHPDTNGQGA